MRGYSPVLLEYSQVRCEGIDLSGRSRVACGAGRTGWASAAGKARPAVGACRTAAKEKRNRIGTGATRFELPHCEYSEYPSVRRHITKSDANPMRESAAGSATCHGGT